MVHVKESALTDLTLCLIGGDKTWTTRQSALVMATCPECLSYVLQENCGTCHGTGKVSNGGCSDVSCCGPDFDCPGCSQDLAEELIEERGKLKPANGDAR